MRTAILGSAGDPWLVTRPLCVPSRRPLPLTTANEIILALLCTTYRRHNRAPQLADSV